ncbi:hypothetical protein [Paraburkholderia hospita]|uniref:hypothetical protein n=1 Tax=Paraburkholderia hospita TaxID=169430 RepID=UPI0008A75934|nr:hypothetical protein [Paraburkholderia hospita]SEI14947.1 hypothetical protein SAMN05192544_1025146 [Paraburkholderia hospita]
MDSPYKRTVVDMDESDAMEFWEERAAIMQFDGGRSQPDAEYYAAVLMRRYAERHGIEVKHHWLRSLTNNAGEWSDAEARPISKRESYVPPTFRG